MRAGMAILVAVLMPAIAAAHTPLHMFADVAISPDGRHVASTEYDDLATDTEPAEQLVIRDMSGRAYPVALACGPGPDCKPASPNWSADGRTLAFLVQRDGGAVTDIDTVPATGGTPQRLLAFDGPLDGLRYGPGDRLAVLATASAHKRLGRTSAGAPLVGNIGSDTDEQRIAVVTGHAIRFVSPPDLYVYQYDWRPDGGFVGTAAHGDGDSNWWVARLYAFDSVGTARTLYAPPPREQLASPIVSPDGRRLAFIGGWMSDFGSTGGDAYMLALDTPASVPVNLTSGARFTTKSIDWHCGDGLTGVTIAGDAIAVARLDRPGPPLWSGRQSNLSVGGEQSIACSRSAIAGVAESFTGPPELVAGPIGRWHAITQANAGYPAPFSAKNVIWRNDGFDVQGWLLSPAGGPQTARRPMIVLVHGGPEAAAEASFPAERGTTRAFLARGWAVFEPNYRGSFGQGEAFATASIQDLGGGDWRDVLTGVDAAEHAMPIDDGRLGITGGSYGGYMTMWAVTQTHRFRAGVANAGVSDWLSIEGEAPQAGSDDVNFGGSVYDDPAAYLRASPITHMRGVTTPVLITVGEDDLECPMPQSQEFHTALTALNVPTQFIVYAGEGHRLRLEKNRNDRQANTLAWFSRWFAAIRK